MTTSRPAALCMRDQLDRLVVDDRVDDLVQRLGDDLAHLRDVPPRAHAGQVGAHPLDLVVVGAGEREHELRVRAAQHGPAVDQSALVERLAEREHAGLGDDRLVEIEERRGACGSAQPRRRGYGCSPGRDGCQIRRPQAARCPQIGRPDSGAPGSVPACRRDAGVIGVVGGSGGVGASTFAAVARRRRAGPACWSISTVRRRHRRAARASRPCRARGGPGCGWTAAGSTRRCSPTGCRAGGRCAVLAADVAPPPPARSRAGASTRRPRSGRWCSTCRGRPAPVRAAALRALPAVRARRAGADVARAGRRARGARVAAGRAGRRRCCAAAGRRVPTGRCAGCSARRCSACCPPLDRRRRRRAIRAPICRGGGRRSLRRAAPRWRRRVTELVDRVRHRLVDATPGDLDDARARRDRRHRRRRGAGRRCAARSTPSSPAPARSSRCSRCRGVTDVLVNAPGLGLDRPRRGLERARGAVRRRRRGAPARAAAGRAAGRRLDDALPFVDAALPDGTRLHAVLPPLCAHTDAVAAGAARAGGYDLADAGRRRRACPPRSPTLLRGGRRGAARRS